MRVRAKRWVFTINNFEEDDEYNLFRLADDDRIKIMIAEHEWGENNTPHIQGYMTTTKQLDRSIISNWLGNRAHLEIARGSLSENIKYCSKEGTVFVTKGIQESIEDINKNERKITIDVINDMKKLTPSEFEERYPIIYFYHRNNVLQTMMEYKTRNIDHEWNGDLTNKNIWVWGIPGVGKSKWASERLPKSKTFKKGFNKWWDGYNMLQHKLVIIEDYPSSPTGNALVWHIKNWADRYWFAAEVKGSSMQIYPGNFFLIVTSNYRIDQCFDNPQDIDAIKRRFWELEMTAENLPLLKCLSFDENILD